MGLRAGKPYKFTADINILSRDYNFDVGQLDSDQDPHQVVKNGLSDEKRISNFNLVQKWLDDEALQYQDYNEAVELIKEELELQHLSEKEIGESLLRRLPVPRDLHTSDPNGPRLGQQHLPHQVCFLAWALQKARSHGGAICADGCGLGKTTMLILLLIAMRHRAGILGEEAKPSLVVVPAHIDIQWNKDLNNLLGVEYSVHQYTQTSDAAAKLFNPQNYMFIQTEDNDPSTHVVLITYPRLQRLTPDPDFRGLFGNVFCDEAHALKNFMGTKQGAVLAAFDFTYRWAFTATVIWNSISDICGYLQFLERPEWQDSHRLEHDRVGPWLRARGFEDTRQDTDRARSMIPQARDYPDGSDSSWECDTIRDFSRRKEIMEETTGHEYLLVNHSSSTSSTSEGDQEITLESSEHGRLAVSPVLSDMSASSRPPRVSPVLSDMSASSRPPRVSPVLSDMSASSRPPRVSPVLSDMSASSRPPLVSPLASDQSHANSYRILQVDCGSDFDDPHVPCSSMSAVSSGRLARRLRKKNLRCHKHYPQMLVINRLASPVDSVRGFALEKRGLRKNLERAKRSRWTYNPFHEFSVLDPDHYKCLTSRAWKAYCEPHIKSRKDEREGDRRARRLKTGDRVRKIFSALVISRNSSSRIKIDGEWQSCGQNFPDMIWRTQDLDLTAEEQARYDVQEKAILGKSIKDLVRNWAMLANPAIETTVPEHPKETESKAAESHGAELIRERSMSRETLTFSDLEARIRIDEASEGMLDDNRISSHPGLASDDIVPVTENGDVKNDSTYKALLTLTTHLNSGALFDMDLKVFDYSLPAIVDRFRNSGRLPEALMDISPDTDEKLLQQALFGSPKLRCFIRQVEFICYSERARKQKILGWFMYPDTMYLCQKVCFS